MLANCIGLRYYGDLRARNFRHSKSNTYRIFTGSRIYQKISTHHLGKIPPENLAISPVYSNFLFERLKIAASLDSTGKPGTLSDPAFQQRLLELIRKQYTGKLKDKLLTLFILHFFKNSSFDTDNYALAMKEMDDTLYTAAIKKIAKLRKPGNSFTDFSLPDTKGKQVSLSSMKDKVVILDFWYTGCSNCVKLKKAMEPIYNQFHANENVRFVSISIDQDRSGWLNSVKGGSYTNPVDINLYTVGEGARHPVIRDNLISGYPTLYVLKNGKIHSSSTPKLGTPAGRAAFSQLILDAITK